MSNWEIADVTTVEAILNHVSEVAVPSGSKDTGRQRPTAAMDLQRKRLFGGPYFPGIAGSTVSPHTRPMNPSPVLSSSFHRTGKRPGCEYASPGRHCFE